MNAFEIESNHISSTQISEPLAIKGNLMRWFSWPDVWFLIVS